MKIKLFIICVVFAFTGCTSDKLDVAKARETAEKCLVAVDKEDYNAVVNEYYASELGGSQSVEELSAKFKKLKEVTGAMKSFELKESVNSAEALQESTVVLTYVVKHERVTTNEKFVIILEGGKYKISLHAITNE